MNLKPQQPLIGMIFNHADPRYAGRLDDKQSGDIIVIMDRLEKQSTFNMELWLTIQHGCGSHWSNWAFP